MRRADRVEGGERGPAGRRGGGCRGAGAALFVLGALGASPTRPRDLRVDVPPGSALEWTRSFPALRPRNAPLFPTSPAGEERTRTDVGPADVRLADTTGLTRITTWDVGSHVSWLLSTQPRGPVSGSDRPRREAALPRTGDALYWLGAAPLLRLMLHRSAVSEDEVLAHLVEIGEPVLPVAAAAASEPSLADAARRLRVWIDDLAGSAPPHQAGAKTRDELLERLVFEELVAAHPWDPSGRFGARLFLFGIALEPQVTAYTQAPGAFLRRNAVAALARFPTASATRELVRLAAGTDDPVVLARALAALDRDRLGVDSRPLVARLREEEDPLARTMLIGALGRLGREDAVPALLEAGRGPLEGDSDGTMTLLAALARIRYVEWGEEVAEFIGELRLRSDRDRWRVALPEPPNVQPDDRDSPGLRIRILDVLALLARSRAEPELTTIQEQILDLSGRKTRDGPDGLAEVQAVPAYTRLLYLETLRRLGEEGIERLVSVAVDPRVESVLRAAALRELPTEHRRDLLLSMAQDRAVPPALAASVVALLALDRPEGWEGRVLELLRRAADVPRVGAGPERRLLWLTALLVLEEWSELGTKDLLPLLAHARGSSLTAIDAQRRVRALVDSLVDAAVGGAPADELAPAVDELLSLVRAHGLGSSPLDGASVESRKKWVVDALTGVRESHDPARAALLRDAVLEHVLGRPPDRMNDAPELSPYVPFGEEVLFALGRAADPGAVEALLRFVEEDGNDLRAVGCLALGLTDNRSVATDLARFLLDPDPFVRFCADESLRRLTGHDEFADWMYGPSEPRFAAAEAWWRWTLGMR